MTTDVRARAVPSTRSAPAEQRPQRRRIRREHLIFLAFILPDAAIILIFAYWPILYNAFLSLTRWDLVAPRPEFVGLKNYVDIFTDTRFLGPLWQTAVFTIGVVGLSIVLGVLIAVLLNQKIPGRGIARTVIFAPYVLPGAAAATIWLMMYDPNHGVSRWLFGLIGMASPNWMNDSHFALIGLIIVYTWKHTGFCAIVYLSALQGLPQDQYEAADLDGAGPVKKFFSLTLPFLSPTTFFLLVTTTIATFQAFDIIATMTGGGPARSTTTLSWYIYQEGFETFNMGYAAAGAIVMFVILLIITAVQSAYVGRRVHYQ